MRWGQKVLREEAEALEELGGFWIVFGDGQALGDFEQNRFMVRFIFQQADCYAAKIL